MMLFIDILLMLTLAYLVAGMAFAVYFYWRGGKQLDEGTAGTPWHFKAIIFPGLVLFWLVLFLKLVRK